MTSVVSLKTFANSSRVPIVVFVDMQQEYLGKLRLPAISRIDRASCEPFTALANQSRGGIVLAGFAGESACLSTSIDAFQRNHKVTYLCDASASHALDEMPADEVHRAVSKISGVYGDACETADWIEQTLPRKFANGRNAGG